MSNEPKVGDVVELKSGGPKMTVERIEDDPESKKKFAYCLWFDNDAKKEEKFSLDVLHIPPKQKRSPPGVMAHRDSRGAFYS